MEKKGGRCYTSLSELYLGGLYERKRISKLVKANLLSHAHALPSAYPRPARFCQKASAGLCLLAGGGISYGRIIRKHREPPEVCLASLLAGIPEE